MTDPTPAPPLPFSDEELPIVIAILYEGSGRLTKYWAARLAATLESLQSENAALRKDKERLDYIEQNHLSLERHSFGYTLWSGDRANADAIRVSMGGTWRSAVDAARAAGEGGV